MKDMVARVQNPDSLIDRGRLTPLFNIHAERRATGTLLLIVAASSSSSSRGIAIILRLGEMNGLRHCQRFLGRTDSECRETDWTANKEIPLAHGKKKKKKKPARTAKGTSASPVSACFWRAKACPESYNQPFLMQELLDRDRGILMSQPALQRDLLSRRGGIASREVVLVATGLLFFFFFFFFSSGPASSLTP